MPGDFNLTERIHVNYFVDRLGVAGTRSVAHVAIQQRLGLLSKRRPGSGAGYFADLGVNGQSLAATGLRWGAG